METSLAARRAPRRGLVWLWWVNGGVAVDVAGARKHSGESSKAAVDAPCASSRFEFTDPLAIALRDSAILVFNKGLKAVPARTERLVIAVCIICDLSVWVEAYRADRRWIVMFILWTCE